MKRFLAAIACLMSGALQASMSDLQLAESVLVDKSERKLYLIRNGEPFREFEVALGFHPVGKKLKEGDGKTPEGTYVLDWRKPSSRFYRSIHISYPNEEDVLQAMGEGHRPGGMIMLHGYPDPKVFAGGNYRFRGRDWTDGCIAVTNEAMDEIWYAVSDGTPIIIQD